VPIDLDGSVRDKEWDVPPASCRSPSDFLGNESEGGAFKTGGGSQKAENQPGERVREGVLRTKASFLLVLDS